MAAIITLNCNTSLAIQGGSAPGKPVTVQTVNMSNPNPLQVFDLVLQRNGAFYGFALVNPSTGLSICYNGQNAGLISQIFGYGSQYPDAWILENISGGTVRFAYPPSTIWTFNDLGGACKAGDTVAMWNDAGQNSLWKLSLYGTM